MSYPRSENRITTPPPPHYDGVVSDSRVECERCEGIGWVFEATYCDACPDCRGQGRKATGCGS